MINYDENDIDKRYLWWVLGAIWKTAETGIAIRGLVKDCQDWSNNEADGWGKFLCVYGAISTLATLAGAGWATYKYGAGIWHALSNILEYRDSLEYADYNYTQKLVEYQLVTVNATRLPWSPVFDDAGYLLLDTRIDGVSINFGYDHNGIPAHMSYNFVGGLNNSVAINLRHQVATKNNTTKREQFNEQDFTSGGLEAGFSYNQEYDGGWLDTGNDYGQMDHEVSCNLADLSNNGLQFQIYDNNHDGTIAAGNIRACEAGAYDSDSLFQFQLPTPINQNCAVA